MQIGVWIAIVVSAVFSFLIANLFEQPLHWYLFVIIIFTGFFIHTIILILKTKEEEKSET